MELPMEKRKALEAAVQLERMLRAVSGNPQSKVSLGGLAYQHREEFTSYAALARVMWIRDDIAHGLDESSLQDCEHAAGVFMEAIRDIEKLYSRCDRDHFPEADRGRKAPIFSGGSSQFPTAVTRSIDEILEGKGVRDAREHPTDSRSITRLARELGIEPAQIIELLPQLGVSQRKTALSVINAETVNKVRQLMRK